MRKNPLQSKIVLTSALVCALAASALAGGQSIRHDRMDARAAARDIARLERDRARAERHHDWKKVAQDNRLIKADRRWVRKDVRKIVRSRG